jgi:hypothetical protein
MSRHHGITRARRPRGVVLALSVVVAAAGLVGAAFADPQLEAGDGLSDAAKETAKPSGEQRVLHADDDRHDQGDGGGVSGGVAISIGQPGCAPPRDFGWRFPQKMHVTPMAVRSQLASPDFGPSQLFGLRVGVGDPRRTSLDVAFLAGAARFTAGSDMERLLRRPHEIAGEISVRHTLTSYDAPVRVAPLMGFRAGLLTWNYLNGIWLESDGEVFQVGSDQIAHYAPVAGVAVAYGLGEHVEIGGTLLGGWRFYASHSDHGLRNDLFLDTGFTELRFETRFVF